MLFVEMSSCTRKMYGGGMIESLRRKEKILADLEKLKVNSSSNNKTRQNAQMKINAVTKEVATLRMAIANKQHIKGLSQLGEQAENRKLESAPNLEVANGIASGVGKLFGNAQAAANAANAATKAAAQTTPSAAPGITPGAVNNALKKVNESKALLKVAAEKANSLTKNLKKLANMTGGRRRTRRKHRTRRRRN
jgi:hypothetical protein